LKIKELLSQTGVGKWG